MEHIHFMNANFTHPPATTSPCLHPCLFFAFIAALAGCQKSDSIPTTADRLKAVEQRQETVPDFYVPRKAVDYMADLKAIKDNAAKAPAVASTPAAPAATQTAKPAAPAPATAEVKQAAPAAPPPVAAPAPAAPTPTAPAANVVASAQPTARPAPPKEVAPTLTVLSRERPQFPKEAARTGVDSGRVRAKLMIDASGSVSSVVIVEAAPSRIFDRSVIQALSQWKFNPGEAGRTYETEINFKL
jgi:periplasmic protein TonB